ncbi:MAG: cyclase family protein [Chloroflexi bacterium]|nr:cyclase family protein [Chloroflexota bacterium]
MAQKLVDLTLPISRDSQVHPLFPKVMIWEETSHEQSAKALNSGFSYAANVVQFIDHASTHVDALSHFNPDPAAPSIDEMPPDTFWGEAVCIDLSFVPDHSTYTRETVEKGERESGVTIKPGDILVIHSAHVERHLGKPEYLTHYSGFDGPTTDWLLTERGVRLVAVECNSVDVPGVWSFPSHIEFRKVGKTHVENLSSTRELVGKRFNFFALPLKFKKGTGSPVRAFALVDE